MTNKVERIYLVYGDETLLLDRKEGSLEYAHRRSPERFFYHLYQDKDQVAGLLDFLAAEVTLSGNEGNDYRMIVDFEQQPRAVFSGTFDENGLPTDWMKFVEQVKGFMAEQEDGKIIPSERNQH